MENKDFGDFGVTPEQRSRMESGELEPSHMTFKNVKNSKYSETAPYVGSDQNESGDNEPDLKIPLGLGLLVAGVVITKTPAAYKWTAGKVSQFRENLRSRKQQQELERKQAETKGRPASDRMIVIDTEPEEMARVERGQGSKNGSENP